MKRRACSCATLIALWASAAAAHAAGVEATGLDSFTWSLPYLETIATDEIPQRIVTSMAEDRAGFLWIGSQQGLFRYDGYRLRGYRHDAMDARSIAGDFVLAITAADDGRLWVGTNSDGISVYDPACDCFAQHFRHEPALPSSLGDGSVNAIEFQSDGSVLVGTGAGLSLLKPGAAQFGDAAERFDQVPKGSVHSLLRTADGGLWVGATGQLSRLSRGAKEFESITVDNGAAGSDAPQFRTLFQAADGKVWIGTRLHGAAWWSADAPTLHWLALTPASDAPSPGEFISEIAQSRAEEVWLGSYGAGLIRVSAVDGRVLQRLQYQPALTGGLTQDRIGALLVDRSGLLWIGLWGGGLQRYNPRASGIRSLRQINHAQSMSRSDVSSILERRDGTLLIGTAGYGVDILDRGRGLIGGYRVSAAAGGLGDGRIQAMAEAADGSLWVATLRGGVYRLPQDEQHWERFGTEEGLPALAVRNLLIARDASIWVATIEGLGRLGPKSATFETIDLARSESRPDFRALAEDRDGRIWAGSASGGLWVAEPGQDQFLVIRHDKQRADSLSSDSVQGLLVGRRGELWVDTAQGLDRLLSRDGDSASFEHISQAAGRRGLYLGANLLEDRRGRIWTQWHVLDTSVPRIHALGAPYGVDLGTAWGGSYATTHDGLFLFGGTQGVVIIDPERFEPWQFDPPVAVTELKVNGRSEPAGAAAELALGPHRDQFSVEFAALDYFDPARNRYAYRLLGSSDEWIEASAEYRIASFGGLSPGSYTLEVRASGASGEWSPHTLRMPIRMAPAYWQTPWFATLVVLGLIGLGWAGARQRNRRLDARAAELRTQVEARTIELRQSNTELDRSKREVEAAHARLVNTQQQLVLQEKMAALGTLTAGVAHEINNPTNFADGAVQQLQAQLAEFHVFLRDLAGADASPRVLEAIAARFREFSEMTSTAREGHERIKRIVRDLRQFTRLDEAERKQIPIADPIQSTVNLVRTRFDRIRFDLDLDFNPSIECQPAKLGQVFMNLIVNACQAIEQCRDGREGVVRIATLAVERGVEITVTDNGAGMDEATRQHVFEPFFTTKDVGTGTGLGLAIVFGIVRDHGGSIEVTSAPGQGSRFVLTLPLGGTG